MYTTIWGRQTLLFLRVEGMSTEDSHLNLSMSTAHLPLSFRKLLVLFSDEQTKLYNMGQAQ